MKEAMNRWAVIAVSVLLVSVAGAIAAEAPLTESDAKTVARKYTEQFYSGQLAVLHGKFTEQMKETMDIEAFRQARSQFEQQLGDEAEMLDERIEKKDDYLVYVRRARFQKFAGVIEVRWVLTASKGIAGVFFSPEKDS